MTMNCDLKRLGKKRFDMFDETGQFQKCKGAYAITDGGMHKRACFVDPMPEKDDEILYDYEDDYFYPIID